MRTLWGTVKYLTPTHFSNFGGYAMDSRWNPTEICKSDYSDVIYHSTALFKLGSKIMVYFQL
jgi:hypothetical protein